MIHWSVNIIKFIKYFASKNLINLNSDFIFRKPIKYQYDGLFLMNFNNQSSLIFESGYST